MGRRISCTRNTVPSASVRRSLGSTSVPSGKRISKVCCVPMMLDPPTAFMPCTVGSIAMQRVPVLFVMYDSLLSLNVCVLFVGRAMVQVVSSDANTMASIFARSIADSTAHIPSHELGRSHPHVSRKLVGQHLQAVP